jgi:hypothetical protein
MIRKQTIFKSALCFLAVGYICKSLNGNFDTKDLLPPTPSHSIWDVSQEESMANIQTVLKQKFTFLGKGHQAFAFVSEDGNYVLKLFKPHYPHIETLGMSLNFTYIPFAKALYRLFAKEKYQTRIEEDLTSYVNALHKFKKESCLEYIHLAHTDHLHTQMQIFDKNGIIRKLDADSTCFLLQRKVTPLEDTLKKLLSENNIEQARLVTQKLIDLLSLRFSLGFYKPTHKFHANFGCVGLEPVQLDVGRLLSKEDLHLENSPWKPDMAISLKKLYIWMEGHVPALIPHVTDLLQVTE